MAVYLEQKNTNANAYNCNCNLLIQFTSMIYLLFCLIGQMSLIILINLYRIILDNNSTLYILFYCIIGLTLLLIFFMIILIVLSIFIKNIIEEIFSNTIFLIFSIIYLLSCLLGQISLFWVVGYYNTYIDSLFYTNAYYYKELSIWYFSILGITLILIFILILGTLKNLLKKMF